MADTSGLLTGKAIVVTGCSSGIGAATVREAKAAGATVIGIDLKQSDAVDKFVEADLSDASSIDAAIAALPDGLDGLCNIAGVPPTFPAAKVLQVNFIGLRRLTYGMIDKLADGAAITNLASLAGRGWESSTEQVATLMGLDDMVAVRSFAHEQKLDEQSGRSYALSKEALIVWTMQNRWTWRDRGIRMNCVSPGPVDTPILKDFLATLGERAKKDRAVMDRPATPEDIAPLVVFLQSDGSGWMRGLNLPCDGGMSSHVSLQLAGLV